MNMISARPQVLLLALLSMTVNSFAQTELFTCSESGAGSAYFKVCASDTGNITLFKSPWGMEHIRVGDPYSSEGALEGFMVCRHDANRPSSGYVASYYDAGNYYPRLDNRPAKIAGWNKPYRIDQPGGAKKFPLTIYRRTSDGIFELKQGFSINAAEREVTITMTLTNKSKQTQQDVSVVRLVDMDIDNGGYDDAFHQGQTSVVQFNQDPGGAIVSLRAATKLPVGFAGLGVGGGDYYEMCGGSTRWRAEAIDGLAYSLGSIAPGASRTVRFVYSVL